MNLFSNLPTFVFSVLLLAMIPGQGTAMLIKQTLFFGSRTAALTVVSYTSGFTLWGLFSALGFAGIILENNSLLLSLKYFGASYLSFLSVQGFIEIFRKGSKFDFSKLEAAKKATPIRTGIITSLTNIKVASIAVIYLPTFVSNNGDFLASIFWLSVIWALISMSWYLTLVFSLDRLSSVFLNSKARTILTFISCSGLLLIAYLLVSS